MSTLKADTIQNTSGGAATLTKQSAAKAWFIFDQVNSNTLDNSLNISSMTDRAGGCMYGNFTNSMDSVDYVHTAASSPVASGSMGTGNNNRSTISSADTAARCSMNVFNTDTVSTFANEENQQGLVHGDLA